jgi:hypothetical protein
MNVTAEAILAQLQVVADERSRRDAQPELAAKVSALKEWQQHRFCYTYADLLPTKRYGAATKFFLDELYGPSDFSRRDRQFTRVVPALVHLFPNDVVQTVVTLARLHALSEVLDTSMALNITRPTITPRDYALAWQAIGRRADRESQIALTLDIASRLDQFTRKPILRHSLRLMRGPARASGLADLQQFLEAGFDTFHAMKGAQEFIEIVGARERALASLLFEADMTTTTFGSVAAQLLRNLPPTAVAVDQQNRTTVPESGPTP